jgi:hypothetical protein
LQISFTPPTITPILQSLSEYRLWEGRKTTKRSRSRGKLVLTQSSEDESYENFISRARVTASSRRLSSTLSWAAHVKISHLVTSLSTSRQQVVFALLVTSCQQVWNKLLTTCNNLVDIIRLVARLFQQVRYSHDIAVLLQPCVVNLVTFSFIMTVSDSLEQLCYTSDNAIKLVTSC